MLTGEKMIKIHFESKQRGSRRRSGDGALSKQALKDEDDIALARLSSRGDRDAFGELCERKQRDLYFYCLSMLGNHHDAEDAVQSAVLSMWLNIRRLDRPEGFRAWMLRIAHNKCLDLLRARSRKAGHETDMEIEEIEIAERNADAIPEKHAENAELSEALYEMVLKLPEKRRETILLYYYEGLSTVEIAKVSGLTPGSVQGALSKARAQLMEMMEEKEGFKELAGRSGAAPFGLYDDTGSIRYGFESGVA